MRPAAPILLVDDEPANLLAMEAVLEGLGEPLVRASSGAEAMRLLRDQDFAAVLLDLHMPGMDGIETARLIRAQKRSRETPILFITADASELSQREAYSLGAVDFIVKPFRTAPLLAKLAFFIELHRSRAELYEAQQRLLLESESRYRTLFESIDQGFCLIEMVFDAAGKAVDYRFLETNPAFVRETGLVNVTGKSMRELVPDNEEHWYEIYGRVARTGQSVRFEQEAKALGRWYDVHAVRLGGAESNRVAVLFSDITQRRNAEESLRRLAEELAETDRRKTEFLATLAHELRNPLAPISNGLHLLKRAGDPLTQEKAREMMERQLRHMVHLVDDLLDIARISSNKVELRVERLDMATVLAGAVETSAPLVAAAGHTLDVDIPSKPLCVQGDATRLAQIVSNLLNNAAKYTPPGGRIELVAREEGSHAVVRVHDTGVGIPPAELPKVFEMFTQVGRNLDRSQGGLGIGLALVKRLVELHGGTIEARSEGTGRGSTFTLRLPLAIVESRAADAPASHAALAAAPAFRVLVVDDNVDAAESLGTLLQIEGHDVRIAHDGDSALSLAAEFRPRVVFLDIGMPGKDGYQVAREMRALEAMRDATLVALTGWGAQEDRARSRSAGFDHHLTKPAGLASVDALLAEIAAERPQAHARVA
ncbi:hybrid sensor histidine kinase/response regulator [Ramlibacter sp. PS4R-6]|uniref:hybrid sensor histidine kinase/response regulator n=1 Tax=Ramlibacter sp. PS4R-6 TaxID=3133438 RepID=UPI0030A4B837